MGDCVKPNVILVMLFRDVSCMCCEHILNTPFSLLFYATRENPRIYKANLDGTNITEIVTTGVSYVTSIAINYDK